MLPTSTFMSSVDPNEIKRINSGRPASRSEILERHMREHRFNAETVTLDQSLQSDGREHVALPRHTEMRSTPNPVASIRRGISRALITVGERINPEAA